MRRRERRKKKRKRGSRALIGGVLLALIGLLLSTATASAQQWKYVYGADTTFEYGMNRVIPVTGNCTSQQNGGNHGYIAVGSGNPANRLEHVYIVRTDNNGARVWENSYDIAGDSLPDLGYSIVELDDGTGFAVTGHTFNEDKNEEVFIMKINCAGNVVWVFTYGTDEGYEHGYDIIETTSGDPTLTPPTNAGDLVVAGWVDHEVSSQLVTDGYILRVDANGALLWDKTYDSAPSQPGADYTDRFKALIEASPVGTASTGDIIAVGEAEIGSPNWVQGWVARVDGNDGTSGNTTRQRSGHYGGPIAWDCTGPQETNQYGDERFESVIELIDTTEVDMNGVPNVVIVGSTTAPDNPDVYAIKLLGGDPCVVSAERVIGDKTDGKCHDDFAYSVREVGFEMGGDEVAQYDLVVTGATNRENDNGDADAFLLTLDPATLQRITGIEMVYGQSSSTSDLHEEGRSLHPVEAVGGRTEGFIICGMNNADPLGVGDDQDLYLIKTNSAGAASSTGDCEKETDWGDTAVSWDACANLKDAAHGTDDTTTTDVISVDTDDEICTGSPKKGVGAGNAAGAVLSFSYSPNPVSIGRDLEVRGIRGSSGEVRVRLVDAVGRIAIDRQLANGQQSLLLPTGLLPSGTYRLVLEDVRSIASTSIVLVE